MDKNLEQQMRKIAQEVYNQNSSKNQYRPSGIPIHVHNGSDAPNISSHDITEFSELSADPNGVLGANNYNGGTFISSTSGNTNSYGIPIVTSGGGVFNGGDAPTGTMVLSTGGTFGTTFLWVRVTDETGAGVWYGFQADLST